MVHNLHVSAYGRAVNQIPIVLIRYVLSIGSNFDRYSIFVLQAAGGETEYIKLKVVGQDSNEIHFRYI